MPGLALLLRDGLAWLKDVAARRPLAIGDRQPCRALLLAPTLGTGGLCIATGSARLSFPARFLSWPILMGYPDGIAVQRPKLLANDDLRIDNR
jgi:hypothetical protein